MELPSRFELAHLPTPLEPLHRLSEFLGGPELWIKRDDQTGLATGGNKARKLEFLIAEALAQDAEVVLTTGAAQSNHCRQTVAAAVRAGLDCVLVLRGEAPPRDRWNGNLLLDDLLGARFWWSGSQDSPEALAAAAEAERAAGRRAYVIPLGGSNPVGASAYALAFQELWDQISQQQLAPFDRVVFASRSGGTHAGLIVGAKACGYEGQVLGISLGKTSADLRETVAALLVPTAERLKLDLFLGEGDVHLDEGHVGAGYGVVTGAEREAIRLLARLEGILLDPVYTGKAMAGLIDLIRQGQIEPSEKVLFWHTGGTPALFAHAADLMQG